MQKETLELLTKEELALATEQIASSLAKGLTKTAEQNNTNAHLSALFAKTAYAAFERVKRSRKKTAVCGVSASLLFEDALDDEDRKTLATYDDDVLFFDDEEPTYPQGLTQDDVARLLGQK